MSVSPRTILELVSGAVLTGLLVWQLLTAAALRTERADLRTQLKGKDLIIQATDVTARSCQATLGRVQLATSALVTATESAHTLTGLVLQAAQDRAPMAAQTIDRLLRVRAPEGQDCQIARRLAQSAWEDRQ